jgi:hypothetical protein
MLRYDMLTTALTYRNIRIYFALITKYTADPITRRDVVHPKPYRGNSRFNHEVGLHQRVQPIIIGIR